jgi:hypothetical protein
MARQLTAVTNGEPAGKKSREEFFTILENKSVQPITYMYISKWISDSTAEPSCFVHVDDWHDLGLEDLNRCRRAGRNLLTGGLTSREAKNPKIQNHGEGIARGSHLQIFI